MRLRQLQSKRPQCPIWREDPEGTRPSWKTDGCKGRGRSKAKEDGAWVCWPWGRRDGNADWLADATFPRQNVAKSQLPDRLAVGLIFQKGKHVWPECLKAEGERLTQVRAEIRIFHGRRNRISMAASRTSGRWENQPCQEKSGEDQQDWTGRPNFKTEVDWGRFS